MQRNTKEIISREALRLFSVHGYEGVSTKAIADAVGIKDSSLYNHFKSKKAIFDELQSQYQSIAGRMMSQLDAACKEADNVNAASFQSVSDIFFEKYLMDDFCNRFIRLMLIEQCGNSEMRVLYHKWMIDTPMQFQSKIFCKINFGDRLSADECEYLSLKYYSPIYLYAHRYLFNGELTDEKKNLFRTAALKHIQKFMTEMRPK